MVELGLREVSAMKVSIIIPVYNVENYLRACLDSVQAQTFKDWECICVDDGSTDDSPAILNEYVAEDSRFHVFRREHSNAGAVRNFGMTKANGEYLMFLDSDDVFSPWMLETLWQKADEENADVTACSAIWFNDGTPVPQFTRNEMIEWQDRTPDTDWTTNPLDVGTMPWNKIIRRNFVEDNHIRFLEQSSTNDLTFMALVLALSRRTYFTNERFIGYRQRVNSIQGGKSKSPNNYFRAVKAFLNGLEERNYWKNFSKQAQIKWFKVYSNVAMWELFSQTSFTGYRSFYRSMRDFHSALSFEWVTNDYVSCCPCRYRIIMEGGIKEHLRAVVEAVFAPILGGWSRREGVRLWISHKTKWFLSRFFDSKRMPWNYSFRNFLV